MTITYDEVFISTIREINICKDYIKAYEKQIEKLQEETGLKASEITQDMLNNKKVKRLYELNLALQREKTRLKELEELIK